MSGSQAEVPDMALNMALRWESTWADGFCMARPANRVSHSRQNRRRKIGLYIERAVPV